MLQCVAVCYLGLESERHGVAVVHSVLQCVTVCCSVLRVSQRVTSSSKVSGAALQCVAVCYSMLQCVTLCCSVLQCVTLSSKVSGAGSDVVQ